jgi:hypothetical protein
MSVKCVKCRFALGEVHIHRPPVFRPCRPAGKRPCNLWWLRNVVMYEYGTGVQHGDIL